MAEIKSTLDLVMERTRHLTLSEDEKQAQQAEEGAKRLQGLIQQYADGALKIDALVDGADRLGAQFDIDGRDRLAAAVTGRIDPDGDSRRWIEVLETVAPKRGVRAAAALESHRRLRTELETRCANDAIERLAAAGIRGTAVVPNPAAAPEWPAAVADLRRKIAQKLSSSEAGGEDA